MAPSGWLRRGGFVLSPVPKGEGSFGRLRTGTEAASSGLGEIAGTGGTRHPAFLSALFDIRAKIFRLARLN